jgi:hypothetical protein
MRLIDPIKAIDRKALGQQSSQPIPMMKATENGMGCSCSWTGFDPNSDKDNPTDAK